MIRKTFLFLLPIPALCLTAGCMFGSRSQAPGIFDLEQPAVRKTALPFQVEFSLFRNLSGADRRLLTRNGNRMEYDGSSRWIQDPELLLERYLRTALRGSGKDVVRIRGVITAFETDSQQKTAVLSVDFTLRTGERNTAFSCTAQEKLSGKTPEQAVKALNACAVRIAAQLEARMKKFMNAPNSL